MKIFAADIGGTSSRFGAFELEPPELKLRQSTWLSTKAAGSFPELLNRLAATDFSLQPGAADIAVFAVAGPIAGDVYSAPPSIDWDVDLSKSREDFGLTTFALINDFLAQAYATQSPIVSRAASILTGDPDPRGTIAVIGAGTGLGKAFLVHLPSGSRLGIPSEGGHANFCSETSAEHDFQKFGSDKLGVSYLEWDDVVSGRGLSLIHEFLSGAELPPAEVAESFESSPETLSWAARFYGRVCRNFVLETLATGGLYIAGGVAAKNPDLVTHPAFADAFHNSPKHHDLLAAVPVALITDEENGLWGAGIFGAMRLQGLL